MRLGPKIESGVVGSGIGSRSHSASKSHAPERMLKPAPAATELDAHVRPKSAGEPLDLRTGIYNCGIKEMIYTVLARNVPPVR